MSGQFAPIRGPYSPGFKQLVRDLLQTDPDFRPAASEVLLKRMPDLLSQFENRYKTHKYTLNYDIYHYIKFVFSRFFSHFFYYFLLPITNMLFHTAPDISITLLILMRKIPWTEKFGLGKGY